MITFSFVVKVEKRTKLRAWLDKIGCHFNNLSIYFIFRNHLSWLEVMARESGSFGHGRPTKFRGMALTGWSRYDHFAVLCELLPVAVPSLVLNLVIILNSVYCISFEVNFGFCIVS